MLNVDQAMREVMAVYQSITGRPIEARGAELPPEVDAAAHVEARYREFKTLLEVSGLGAVAKAPEVTASYAPPADVLTLDGEVRCQIDVPGIPKDRLSVSVAGDWLVVRGERANGVAHGAVTRHRERAHGAVQKLIALPPGAKREAIDASLQDGVLTVTIPTDGAGASAQTQRVNVKGV